MININIPNIGKNELEVTEILVKKGDNINVNQPLLIIEGDKSSIEIPAPHSGIVTKIYIQIGDKVQTGSLILSIDKIKDYDHIQNSDNKKNNLQNKLTEFNFFKNKIKKDNKIIINDVKCHPKPLTSSNNIHATPLIRHMARELEIDLSKIKGSGRKGRILKEDIQNYLNNSIKKIDSNPITHSLQPDPTFISPKTIDLNKFNDTTTIQLNKIQRILGSNLQKNWSIIPHVTQFDVFDITDLEIFRKKQNLEIENTKINYKITILIFVMKVISKVLEEFPIFNSSLSEDGSTLFFKKNINIGIAIDTKYGLFVPVIQDVNKKNIITLSQELSELSQKARIGKQLNPIDMQGGTFTISNLGNIGGSFFTPIINAPEVAILGISKSIIQPVWNGKKFIPRLMLPVSLSYDHRVINGADGARFINRINKIITDIRLLSI